MGANDGQFRKILVQTSHILEPPDFDIENHGFRMISNNVLPQFFAGAGEMD